MHCCDALGLANIIFDIVPKVFFRAAGQRRYCLDGSDGAPPPDRQHIIGNRTGKLNSITDRMSLCTVILLIMMTTKCYLGSE